MLNKKFSAVLIDPDIIEELECDFIGINSIALPALYNLLSRKNTALLDCRILHEKIKSKLGETFLNFEMQQIFEFCDGLEILRPLGDYVDNAVTVIKSIDLPRLFGERFERLYANAIMMPSCNVDDVLGMYYSKLPPFDSLDDDFEIYDALLLSTFIDYADKHPDEQFLVVSDNDDWKYILECVKNVTVVYSVEEVTGKWLPENGFARQLYKRFQQKITERIKYLVNNYTYLVGDCAPGAEMKIDVDSVRVYNQTMSPLQVTDKVASYRVVVDMDIYGKYKRACGMFKDDRWQSIGDASASAALEVEITYDKQDVANTAQVTAVKIVDRGAIVVYIDDED